MRTKEGNKEHDIMQAAIKVFAESGFNNAKISKIAEVAGVATGSVYLYFQNKEQILFTIFKRIWEKLFQEFEILIKHPNLNQAEKIDGMIDLAFDVFASNPSLGLIFSNEQNHQKIYKEFNKLYEKFLDLGEKVLKEGIEGKIFRNDLDIKVCKYFIFGGLRQLILQWSKNPNEFPLNSIRQNMKYLTKWGIQINGK